MRECLAFIFTKIKILFKINMDTGIYDVFF